VVGSGLVQVIAEAAGSDVAERAAAYVRWLKNGKAHG
jgi:hypothetical protein